MLYTIEDKTLKAMGDAVRSKLFGVSEIPKYNYTTSITYNNARCYEVPDYFKKVKITGIIEFNGGSYLQGATQGLGIAPGVFQPSYGFQVREAEGYTVIWPGYLHSDTNRDRMIEFEIIFEPKDNQFAFIGTINSSTNTTFNFTFEVIGLDENGEEYKYTPLEMVEKINGLDIIPPSALNITNSAQGRFAYNGNNWLIEAVGHKMTTNNISDASSMFLDSNLLEEIPFEINLANNAKKENMFRNCKKLQTIPQVNCVHTIHSSFSGLFNYCEYMREVPEWCVDLLEQDYNIGGTNSIFGPWNSMFANCYSLREIPERAIRAMSSQNPTGNYYTLAYSKPFGSCYALDRLVNLCCDDYAFTSNQFSSFFEYLCRIKDIVFATQEDGTPYTRKWKSQTIDLSRYVGYASTSMNYITGYNSGITTDKKVSDDASYQALKDDEDWYTTDINYSRYNHDSAVNTINSLPDCSATGNNTIKFKGASGALTDGGAINTLTEEEIAVATAKGWTVSLV